MAAKTCLPYKLHHYSVYVFYHVGCFILCATVVVVVVLYAVVYCLGHVLARSHL
uniref:Uncharacterized protein n=1 Tax=Anguilla anguilla TaxID=7936 RepID=A0A0E9QKA1_ANGAN